MENNNKAAIQKRLEIVGDIVRFIKSIKIKATESVESLDEDLKSGIQSYRIFITLLRPEIMTEIGTSRTLWAEFVCKVRNCRDARLKVIRIQDNVENLRKKVTLLQSSTKYEVFGSDDIENIAKENSLLEELKVSNQKLKNELAQLDLASFKLASFMKKWTSQFEQRS